MKNILNILLINLALVSAAYGEVTAQAGLIKSEETALETGRLTFSTENNLVFGIYGATDKLEIFKDDDAQLHQISSVTDNISQFGITAGYEYNMLEQDGLKIALTPAVGYEWERRRRDTKYVRAVINGKDIEVSERKYINSHKTLGIVALSATYKQTLVSVAYDSDNRILLTIGMSL